MGKGNKIVTEAQFGKLIIAHVWKKMCNTSKGGFERGFDN